MSLLSELSTRLREAFPAAQLIESGPVNPDGVGFLDITYRGNELAVQWQEDWHFGVSSPSGHGYGEKLDEVFRTVDEAATRVTDLLQSGRTTAPPDKITLRELRTEKQLTALDRNVAALNG